ncbi:MAG: hypothetical protein Q9191_002194 [Dirinaria sp. TL-2023a]
MLRQGLEFRAGKGNPGNAMKKRFWKDVTVRTSRDGNYAIYLDVRPVRNPSNKSLLSIPSSKPHLASAIALEWDLLDSAQQALRSHLIPLTSIASRAHDISLQDVTAEGQISKTRLDLVDNLLRYLDTDTLLCWAPEPAKEDEEEVIQPTLKELQIRTAQPIIAYLTRNIWPGVELKPTFESESILPTAQPATTQAVIKGWVAGLPAWELAGLERAVLAGKSLCVAARLVCEWSEEFAHLRATSEQHRFGIEQAAEACSLEVRWQTGRWGEVEDTHDVDREDLRRQFGSTILVVSGTGRINRSHVAN